MRRGSYNFDVTSRGDMDNQAYNVDLLRQMWFDRSMISGDDLGEGDPGDFDYGAWHIACHLVAAAGVRSADDGRLVWLEISHDPAGDEYHATLTTEGKAGMGTWQVDSPEGQSVLDRSALLGFVEGNSVGRTSARDVIDPPTRFNLWRRQDFDQPDDQLQDGGRVWEHWCTTRDIRPTSRIGNSVLAAYVALTAELGDLFPALVARGRNDYAHPLQLCAMIEGGFIGEQSALIEFTPTPIPSSAEQLLLKATPADSLQAIQMLDWSNPPRYYMFARRINRWCSAETVQQQLAELRGK